MLTIRKPFHRYLQQPLARPFLHVLYHWLVSLMAIQCSPPASHEGLPTLGPQPAHCRRMLQPTWICQIRWDKEEERALLSDMQKLKHCYQCTYTSLKQYARVDDNIYYNVNMYTISLSEIVIELKWFSAMHCFITEIMLLSLGDILIHTWSLL